MLDFEFETYNDIMNENVYQTIEQSYNFNDTSIMIKLPNNIYNGNSEQKVTQDLHNYFEVKQNNFIEQLDNETKWQRTKRYIKETWDDSPFAVIFTATYATASAIGGVMFPPLLVCDLIAANDCYHKYKELKDRELAKLDSLRSLSKIELDFVYKYN